MWSIYLAGGNATICSAEGSRAPHALFSDSYMQTFLIFFFYFVKDTSAYRGGWSEIIVSRCSGWMHIGENMCSSLFDYSEGSGSSCSERSMFHRKAFSAIIIWSLWFVILNYKSTNLLRSRLQPCALGHVASMGFGGIDETRHLYSVE